MTSFSNMRIFTILFTSILIAALFHTAASGQTHTFTNKSVDYVIEFPSAKWRALRSSGLVPARTRKEFIYADRNSVRLLVRRKMVDADVTPSDMIRRRQTWDQHLAGYVLVKEEDFTGQMSGTKFSYGYTQGGKPMIALVYYLEADNRTIYSLLFTGTRDELQSLLDQADSIARSFRLKKSRGVRN
jgi:hypothetical protein